MQENKTGSQESNLTSGSSIEGQANQRSSGQQRSRGAKVEDNDFRVKKSGKKPYSDNGKGGHSSNSDFGEKAEFLRGQEYQDETQVSVWKTI